MTTERTFEHGVFTITVHRQRVRDKIAYDIVRQKLARAGVGNLYTQHTFAKFASQSRVQGMAWVDETSTDEAIAAAFNVIMDGDADLYDVWSDELKLVDQPLNDPALIPPGQVSESEKKEVQSSD